MALQFPTIAEQVETAWKNRVGTQSMQAIVALVTREIGSEWTREFEYPETRYIFDDDTQLVVTGKGVNHRVETRLP